MNDLQKLFISELKSIYDAEHQLVEGLAEMEKSMQTEELKHLFREHLDETKTHINRLERVFREIGETPSGRTCHGVGGIIRESRGVLRQVACAPALILCARKAEHYEISTYGTLCTWAKEIGQRSALDLLKQNLSEEKQADEKLKALAESLPSLPSDELSQLFTFELREMFDAEHLLAQALAELEFYAESKVLKFAFRHHMKQTDKHFARLEKVFRAINVQTDRRACKGVEGIIDDAQVLVLEFLNNPALDAALIAAGQKAEHYEIVTYCTLSSWAHELGETEARALIEKNLSEEKQTDKALSLLASASRNRKAMRHDSPKKSDEEALLAKAITHGV